MKQCHSKRGKRYRSDVIIDLSGNRCRRRMAGRQPDAGVWIRVLSILEPVTGFQSQEMSFFTAFLYDRFMARTEAACLRAWRQALLEQVHGEVLEIGAGTGASIELYPGRVTRLVLSEPDRHMRKCLERRVARNTRMNIAVTGDAAENISADTETFDCVVVSLVCCSVQDLHASLREIRRVLKSGGRLVFLEHVAATQGSSRRRWQDRFNPFWKSVMGNCHLNRETEQAIRAAGFEIVEITRESMRKAIPIVRPTIRGVAVRN